VAIVTLADLLGVDRLYGVVWNWTEDLAEARSDPPTETLLRVAVDEKHIEANGEDKSPTPSINAGTPSLCQAEKYHTNSIVSIQIKNVVENIQ
jgi:hypothetical protein